jgi:hypothetical protein
MFKLKFIFKLMKLMSAFIGFVFISCSSSQQVNSSKNNNEIKVDGIQTDWNQLTNMKGENISFGFSNDRNNLYVSMITNDRSKIMNILRGGLEVWIDPGNSENKIGIRYPEKPDPAEMMEQMKNHIKEGPPNIDKNPKEMMENNEIDPMIASFLSKQKELTVLNEDGNALKSYPIDSKDYQVKIKVDKTSLCYELKVPLGNKPLLNIDLKNNASGKISIDFLSGDIEFQMGNIQRPEGIGGEGNSPSGPPPGGGNNPPPFGGPGDRRMNQGNIQHNSKIDYSFEVTLNK